MRAGMNEEPLASKISALVAHAFGRSARVLRVHPLAGDASSRRYVRVEVEGAPSPTAVVMETAGSGLSISSDELAIFGEEPREMPFLNVQRYLRAIDVAVPEVHGVDAAHGLVLLEDVGDVTLWDAARALAPAERVALYRSAIDEMMRFQEGGTRRPDASCLAFRQRFDARLFAWELDHFLEYGFVGRELAAEDERHLRESFAALAEDLAGGDVALAHRDFHSWNLFLDRGRIRVIDFQDALLAPPPYDLATLLNDRATPTLLDAEAEDRLVDHFLERRAALFGDEADPVAFGERYALFVFQKAAKVVGRFVFLEDVKGKRGYRPMIPGTLATMRRSLERLPRLADLRRTLSRSFPELA
jgi:N-acetylmuramate 1-kinase